MSLAKPVKWFAGVFVALMLVSMSTAAMAGQATGAIFTTLEEGTAVNHNIYSAKEAVYLNGGRSPKLLARQLDWPTEPIIFR